MCWEFGKLLKDRYCLEKDLRQYHVHYFWKPRYFFAERQRWNFVKQNNRDLVLHSYTKSDLKSWCDILRVISEIEQSQLNYDPIYDHIYDLTRTMSFLYSPLHSHNSCSFLLTQIIIKPTKMPAMIYCAAIFPSGRCQGAKWRGRRSAVDHFTSLPSKGKCETM